MSRAHRILFANLSSKWSLLSSGVNYVIEQRHLGEVVASFTSGGTASNLGLERCGKIHGLNSGSETWTGIGVVAGFLAGMGMIEWFYLKITKLPKKDHIVKYYNTLGEL